MLSLKPILENGRHGKPIGVKARVAAFRKDEIPDGYMATEVIYKNETFTGSYKWYFDKEASSHRSEPIPQNVLENIIYINHLDILVPDYLNKIQEEC